MSLQLRCNCGWTSQVSEFYLGDRVTCPDCGNKLNVHARVGVPYGYAPYPTWQKTLPQLRRVRTARHRAYPLFTPQNPHTAPAFWLGLFSMMLTFTGCGAIPGVMLAVFGISSWSKSRKFATSHKQSHEPRATVGMAFSVLTLVLGLVMLLSVLEASTTPDRHRTTCTQQVKPVDRTRSPHHEYRYEGRDADWYRQQAERRQKQEAEWRRLRDELGYRYPSVEPERTPVQPRNEFERKQVEYSERVRKEREAEAARQGYRYRD